MLTQRALLAASVTLGLLELVDVFLIDVPAAAAVFCVLFLASAVWLVRRPRRGAPIVLAFLFAVEIAGVPFYSRTSVTDWVTQIAVGAVAAVGLVAAVATIVHRHRRRSPQPV